MRRFLPWLILLFPALELWVLIQVGKSIGALATVGLVILSTMAGLALLRLRGFHIARSMQAELSSGRIPSNPIVDTFCLMAAGCLFLFPGFVSDILAILLLIPFVRQGLMAVFASRMKAQGFQAQTMHFQSSSGDSGTTWTCTTFGEESPSPRHEARGNAVVIDCEPETPNRDGDEDAAILVEPSEKDGDQDPDQSRHQSGQGGSAAGR